MKRSNESVGPFRLGEVLRLLLSIGCILVVGAGSASANEKIQVTVGQSVTHDLGTTIKTVSIANSQIADVVVAGPRQILLNGKGVGFTTVVVWDDHDRSTVFDVVVRGAFSDQQIELRVNVAEINRTKARQLGVDSLSIVPYYYVPAVLGEAWERQLRRRVGAHELDVRGQQLGEREERVLEGQPSIRPFQAAIGEDQRWSDEKQA